MKTTRTKVLAALAVGIGLAGLWVGVAALAVVSQPQPTEAQIQQALVDVITTTAKVLAFVPAK